MWVGDTNGVQIQIVATWIFYAVLNNLCAQVAVALPQPLETISVEMVFPGFTTMVAPVCAMTSFS